MPVRLLRPYAGQNVGTIYVGADEDILRAEGTADDRTDLATNYIPTVFGSFRAYASSFTTSQAVGSVISGISDPFKGLGRGVTTYATSGTVPGQLSLVGNQVQVGSTTAVVGTLYQLTVVATSGDGVITAPPVTLNFKAVAFSFSAGVPGYSGGGSSSSVTPTLGTLSLSSIAFSTGGVTSVGINGATAGSQITGTSSDGTTLTVSGTTLSGTFSTAGTPTISLVETLAGATGSPKTTPVGVTVTSAVSTKTLTFQNNTPLQFSDGSNLELAA